MQAGKAIISSRQYLLDVIDLRGQFGNLIDSILLGNPVG